MKWQADAQTAWQELSHQILAVPSHASLRFMVLAAHPDDDVIGASVLLARFPDSLVVYLTDGAPHDSRLWTGGPHDSREQYAKTRCAEAIRALVYAAVPEENVCCLGAVDQEASFEMPFLTATFSGLLEQYCPNAIVTHPYEGGHPDHDTAAAIAQMAAGSGFPIIEMTSYHSRDGQCVTGEFLVSATIRDDGVELSEIAVELSEKDRERKRQMFNAHGSQRRVLEGFPIDREPLRPSPGYDFSRPPHSGVLWYESLGWPMTGARWRELTASARLQRRSCA